MWIDAYNAVTTNAGRYVQGGGCATVGVAGLVQSGCIATVKAASDGKFHKLIEYFMNFYRENLFKMYPATNRI